MDAHLVCTPTGGLTPPLFHPTPHLLPPTSHLGPVPPLPDLHTLLPNSEGSHPHQPLSWVLSTLRLCRRRTGGLHPLPGVLGCMVVPALAPARLGEAFTESIFPSKLSLQGWLLQLKIALKFNCLRLVTPFSGLPSTSLCLHVPCCGGQDALLILLVLQPASPQAGLG